MNVIIPNEGEVKPAEKLLQAAFDINTIDYNFKQSFNNLSLTLHVDDQYKKNEWVCQLIVNKKIYQRGFYFQLDYVKYGSKRNLKHIEIIAFVDRVFPSYLNKFKFVQEGYATFF